MTGAPVPPHEPFSGAVPVTGESSTCTLAAGVFPESPCSPCVPWVATATGAGPVPVPVASPSPPAFGPDRPTALRPPDDALPDSAFDSAGTAFFADLTDSTVGTARDETDARREDASPADAAVGTRREPTEAASPVVDFPPTETGETGAFGFGLAPGFGRGTARSPAA